MKVRFKFPIYGEMTYTKKDGEYEEEGPEVVDYEHYVWNVPEDILEEAVWEILEDETRSVYIQDVIEKLDIVQEVIDAAESIYWEEIEDYIRENYYEMAHESYVRESED